MTVVRENIECFNKSDNVKVVNVTVNRTFVVQLATVSRMSLKELTSRSGLFIVHNHSVVHTNDGVPESGIRTLGRRRSS